MDKPDRYALLRSIDPGVLIEPILGILLVGAGLIALYFIGQVNTLDCKRDDAQHWNCSIITTWMNLSELNVRPVPQLTSAYVQDSCDDDGCTYRVMLSTQFGDLPLTSSYSSGQGSKRSKVNQIRDFVQDGTQPSLRVSDGGGLFILIPLVFTGIGLYLCSDALANVIRKRSE